MNRFLCLLLVLVGCSDSKSFDSSSPDASIVRLSKEMSDADKERFRKDCLLVASNGDVEVAKSNKSDLMKTLNGMTSDQISIKAEEMRTDTAKKELAAEAEYNKYLKNADQKPNGNASSGTDELKTFFDKLGANQEMDKEYDNYYELFGYPKNYDSMLRAMIDEQKGP